MIEWFGPILFEFYGGTEGGGISISSDEWLRKPGSVGRPYNPAVQIHILDDDGYLFLCDRRADVIVTGGVNVYPAQIESVLLDHPAIADCCVVGAPDEEWGETVHAVVQLRAGAILDDAMTDDLRRWCSERLAGYQVLRAFHVVDELPRTETGKMARQVVRASFWSHQNRRI